MFQTPELHLLSTLFLLFKSTSSVKRPGYRHDPETCYSFLFNSRKDPWFLYLNLIYKRNRDSWLSVGLLTTVRSHYSWRYLLRTMIPLCLLFIYWGNESIICETPFFVFRFVPSDPPLTVLLYRKYVLHSV